MQWESSNWMHMINKVCLLLLSTEECVYTTLKMHQERNTFFTTPGHTLVSLCCLFVGESLQSSQIIDWILAYQIVYRGKTSQRFAGSSFSKEKMCNFALFYMVESWESLCPGLLGQIKQVNESCNPARWGNEGDIFHCRHDYSKKWNKIKLCLLAYEMIPRACCRSVLSFFSIDLLSPVSASAELTWWTNYSWGLCCAAAHTV